MLLSPQQIQKIFAQQAISDALPWVKNDRKLVDDFYRELIDKICCVTGCLAKVVWNDYGSGYASYIDAWLYKPNDEFSLKGTQSDVEGYTGLVVLLSRLSPYYVFMEGEKQWHSRGGSSYLPEFSMLDMLQTTAVNILAVQAQEILHAAGLVRLKKSDISSPMPEDFSVPTNLADGDFTEFDAIFHWED